MMIRLQALVAAALLALPQAVSAETNSDSYRVLGPYAHKNLAIYLVRGEDAITAKNILTLDEALELKKAIVHETGQVNELTIENTSDDALVFIPAGSIVKGGKQDRVLSRDMTLGPKSGKVPVDAFCVEQGRWQPRGEEEATKFSSSKKHLSAKGLKIAARKVKEQGQVWQEVKSVQDKLAKNLKADVSAPQSATSLQLTLESKPLAEEAKEYTGPLATVLEGKDDIIGYVFSINGTLNSGDVFASHELFKKLWPGLLDAAVTEALAEGAATPARPNPSLSQVAQFIEDAERSATTKEETQGGVRSIERESEKSLYFESRSDLADGVSIRKSYISK